MHSEFKKKLRKALDSLFLAAYVDSDVDCSRYQEMSERSGVSDLKTLTILIIDDDPLLRALMSRFLKDAQNVRIVGIAETGDAGLKLAKDQQPDIILLDIQLPDADSKSMTDQVKNISPHSRVYLCSAYSDERVEAAVKQVHAEGYVSKTNLKKGLAEMVRIELSRATV